MLGSSENQRQALQIIVILAEARSAQIHPGRLHGHRQRHSRHGQPLQSPYLALIARGKPKKLAIVAVMRTMIATLNAMVRDNKPWNPKHGA